MQNNKLDLWYLNTLDIYLFIFLHHLRSVAGYLDTFPFLAVLLEPETFKVTDVDGWVIL